MGVAQLEEALGDDTLSAEGYKLDTPTLDGHTARNLSLRFSGSSALDPTSGDDVR